MASKTSEYRVIEKTSIALAFGQSLIQTEGVNVSTPRIQVIVYDGGDFDTVEVGDIIRLTIDKKGESDAEGNP